MRIIVVGYGRLGAQVVAHLDTGLHEVVVIDKQRALGDRAGRIASVRFLAGNAIDPELLKAAGAEGAGALFALTRDENTNLMVAQLAKQVFRIPKVMAVVYDPAREPSYRAAGIETMALTVAGAEFIVGQLQQKPPDFADVWKRAQGRAAELPTPLPRMERSGQVYVIVVGGGRVGYFLARGLMENGIEVCIIEANKEIYELVATQVECPVLLGDGSSTAVLEKAEAQRCNVFVAVSNHDQDNLIACQIARQRFGVPKTIARVKNPRNELLMQSLGVDITVSSTSIIASSILSELPQTRFRQVLNLNAGNLEMMEYRLDAQSPVAGKHLRELEFPATCNLVTIFRDGDAIVPRGDTLLAAGDLVYALTRIDAEAQLRKMLMGE